MRIEEFIERYGDKYEYNWDEYDNDRISIYSNSKTGIDVGPVSYTHLIADLLSNKTLSHFLLPIGRRQFSQIKQYTCNFRQVLVKSKVSIALYKSKCQWNTLRLSQQMPKAFY